MAHEQQANVEEFTLVAEFAAGAEHNSPEGCALGRNLAIELVEGASILAEEQTAPVLRETLCGLHLVDSVDAWRSLQCLFERC